MQSLQEGGEDQGEEILQLLSLRSPVEPGRPDTHIWGRGRADSALRLLGQKRDGWCGGGWEAPTRIERTWPTLSTSWELE